MKQGIPISELCVLRMPNPYLADKATIKPWKGMDSLFLAEDCARYTFILKKADVEKLPSQITETMALQSEEMEHRSYPVTILTGMKAYEAILHLAVGLDDADCRTAAVTRYVLPQWKKFRNEHSDRAQDFEGIMRNISSDCSIVDSHTTIAQIPYPSAELATKRLMGIVNSPKHNKKVADKQTVLVVADKTNITQDIIKSLTQNSAVGKVCLTHPDGGELDARWNELQALISDKLYSLKSATLKKYLLTRRLIQSHLIM